MTIRLLKPYAQRPVNAITTFPASVEAGLIAAGKATADLTGGVQFFAPRPGLVLQAKQIAVGTVALQAEEQATVTLPEGQVLLVTGAASTVGAVSRSGSADTWSVAAGALAAIGPYAGPQRLSITCTTGAITATVREAVLATTGAAVATITGTGIVGQPLTATLPAGVVGTLQFTKVLKASPFTKSNISGAVASAVNSLSYTVQSGDALYNIGCDASSTVSSSNIVAVQPGAQTAPGQAAKPVLTAMAGAVSVAWTPGAAGSTATTGNTWTDINGNVTQLTTNPQVITAPASVPYTGTVTTVNAQGAGPASDQADAVTPLVAAPVPTSFSWIIKNTIFGSSAYAAQVGFHNPGRTSILFHNDTPYWGQYVLSGASNNDYNQPTGSWVDIPPNAQVLVTDPGKPYVRGKAFAITSITSDGATATVTTAAPHNLATGASVRVQDVTPAGYNGAFTSVTVTGANTFTYPLTATLAATTAPGTWAGRPLTGFTVQTKAAK